MSWNNELLEKLKNQYEKFQIEIENDLPFEGHEEYNINITILNKHSLLIILGGIFQTLFLSSIAFLLLLYRITIKKRNFTTFDWLLSVVSLFWIREPANLIFGIIKGIKLKNNTYFYGDEVKVAKLLGFHEGTLLLPLTIISLIIYIMVFKIIPNKKKKEFIMAYLIGCPIGYVIWKLIIGPIILP